MKLRIGLARRLALVAALALGPAIVVVGDRRQRRRALERGSPRRRSRRRRAPATTLRPPARSAVLAGMVHAAMYDAVDRDRRRLRAVRDHDQPHPRRRRWTRQSHRRRETSWSLESRARRRRSDGLRRLHGGDPGRSSRRTVARRSARRPRRACSPRGWVTVSTTSCPYVQPTPGPGVFEPIAAGVVNPSPPPTPVSVGSDGAAVHVRHARLPTRRAVRAHEQEVRGRRRRGAAAGPRTQHDSDGPADRDRRASTPTRPTSSSAAAFAGSPTNGGSTCASRRGSSATRGWRSPTR